MDTKRGGASIASADILSISRPWGGGGTPRTKKKRKKGGEGKQTSPPLPEFSPCSDYETPTISWRHRAEAKPSLRVAEGNFPCSYYETPTISGNAPKRMCAGDERLRRSTPAHIQNINAFALTDKPIGLSERLRKPLAKKNYTSARAGLCK